RRRGGAGGARGRRQAQPDRLAVAVALVPARRLDRVPNGVAEVEHGPQAGVALVGRDDLALVARAGEDDTVELRRVDRVDRAGPLPEIAAGQQPRLQDLDEAGAELLLRQARQRRRVGQDRRRQVVGAGVVLALREVDPALAAA